MKIFSLIGVLGLGCMASSCTTNDDVRVGPWDGEYAYGMTLGYTNSGMPIAMNVTLTVKEFSKDKPCVLEMMGYQTSETIICTAIGEGDKLKVIFKKYEESMPTDDYKAGDVLFVLKKVTRKNNKPQYMPQWVNYMPFRGEPDRLKDDGDGSFEKTK